MNQQGQQQNKSQQGSKVQGFQSGQQAMPNDRDQAGQQKGAQDAELTQNRNVDQQTNKQNFGSQSNVDTQKSRTSTTSDSDVGVNQPIQDREQSGQWSQQQKGQNQSSSQSTSQRRQ